MNIKFFILFSLISLMGFSETGTVQGIITDHFNKESLIGVSIAVFDSSNQQMISGTSTDLAGNYSIQLQSGHYVFKVSYVSYSNKEIAIEVKSNENITHHIELEEALFELEIVEVIARVSRESENLLLLDQKESSGIEEKLGVKELSRKGASDVAAGLKKVVGISMMGSKQLFVRGLGDRYNAVQLNGLPIASPDPTKKIVKLNMFPSEIIEYLNVQKAYSAVDFADYTGALININTKDYPDNNNFSVSIGSKYNTQSTGKAFTKINAEGMRYFGFDVKERQKLTPEKYWIAKKRTQVIEPDFNYASYGFTKKTAAPAMDFSLTGGKLFQFNEKRKLGILFNVSNNNEYIYSPDVIQKQVNRQNISDGDFVIQKFSYNSYFTAFGNIAYIHNNKNKLKYNILFLNNGEDNYNDKKGTRPDWQNGEKTALIRNAQYINYRLLSHQLQGENKLKNRFDINWAVGFMNVDYNVPDRREVVYINPTSEEDNSWVYMTLNNGNDSKRVIVEQDNEEIDYNIKLSYQLGHEGDKGQISMGSAGKITQLHYRSYYYGYFFETQEGNLTLAVDIDNPDDYFTPDYLKKIRNNSSDKMGYDGSSFAYAAYINLIFHFNPRLTLNTGLRVESSSMSVTPDMNIDDGDEIVSSYSNIDFFPAINFKYAINDHMNLRLAESRTVIRPSFYEKSPAFIIPEQGNRQIVGNPYTKENPSSDSSYLENAYSNNVEIKWEWFPNLGELISIGTYGKIIEEPIERVSKLKGGTDITYTYQNFKEKGYAAGIELVLRKKFNHLFTGFNAAYIYTMVIIPDSYNEMETKRQLQGASPYLINADLGYEFIYGNAGQHRTYISLIYNVYGKRIYSVGISGAGNQYQMPVNSLDFILRNRINDHLSIDLSIKNIFNAKHTIKQDVYENADRADKVTNRVTINEYTTGINIGISLKYKL